MSRKLIPQKWEDSLRKGVFVVGTALEQVINKAEKIGSNLKGTSSSPQPVLSLEGQLSIPKLKEIINSAVDKTIAPMVPGLVDKTSIEIREGSSSLGKVFKEKGASIAVHMDIGGSSGSYGKPDGGVSSVRSSSARFPFEDGFFDYAVGLYANQFQGDLLKGMKELSRVLSVSGEGVVIDFHPFGMYAKRGNQRLRPISSVVRGVEDYYKLCRSAALRITGIRESFFDETVRSLFTTEEEKSAFRIIKDTPILIYLFVKKGG